MRLAWLCLLCSPWGAQAHKPSDSYLTLTAGPDARIDVVWHVALRDLDGELALDANDDGRLTWGEVRDRWQDMRNFVRPHLQLSLAGEVCEVIGGSDASPALVSHTDGTYAVFAWTQRCTVPAEQMWQGATLSYSLFALSDPTHRGIVRWRLQDGSAPASELGVVVLGGARPAHTQSWGPIGMPERASAPGGLRPAAAPFVSTHEPARPEPLAQVQVQGQVQGQVRRTVREGVIHIAEGTDHILFLVSLLLVSVWQRPHARAAMRWRATQGWCARSRAREVLGEVLSLVTAFTLAHSLTLALATFGVLSPPSRWVESLIALSVLVAALDNLWPLLRAPRWAVVFGFGLVHGFGFAGAMQDLGLPPRDLVWPLLGFNLGVELGQLALVLCVLPLCFALRRTRFYRWGVVLPGSLAIAAMAGVWLIERSTGRLILGWGG